MKFHIDVLERQLQLKLYSELFQPVSLKRQDIDLLLGDLFKTFKRDHSVRVYYDDRMMWYRDDDNVLWIQYDCTNQSIYTRTYLYDFFDTLGIKENTGREYIKRMANKYLNLSRVKSVGYSDVM